jgi:excisionase family DNA binding protein
MGLGAEERIANAIRTFLSTKRDLPWSFDSRQPVDTRPSSRRAGPDLAESHSLGTPTMFDRADHLRPEHASLGRCTLQCPWCELLLRARPNQEVQQGEPSESGRLLLTVDEAAHALGLGRSKTYALAAAGALPVIRLGRSVRVPVGALQRWINAQLTER